ncbi:ATP-binding protein [Roseovarius aestuariivivens]|uniref:ATP-binding protein n=1 Tax=Roseovarius aestuariivivens TaxID=1888910 RepID=UPI0010822012|nr:ATP-binding protein [Roseovarius aestuariivivens]
MNQGHIASLLQAIPLPSVLIGRGERILGANARAHTLLGDGIEGRHFITAIRQPSVLDAVENCLRDRQTRETRYLGSDGGQDTTYTVTCSHVETDAGSGVLVCFEDITQMEQAGQMRRDFVANVSHELRSPLTALLGFIETLRGPARQDPDAVERFLATMQLEASRMERLVKDLLSLSRVEAQERVRPTEAVNLTRLLGAVRHAMRPIAEETNVSLALDLPEAPVTVTGDADQLQQVLTNLIENAVKYGGAGRTVRIALTTASDDGAVRGPSASISVRDEGPGIEPLHIPRLTERFYRVDSHRSRAMGGTGLGLAIVKHIVSRHRGRLRILSEPGEGSEFRVILPRQTV